LQVEYDRRSQTEEEEREKAAALRRDEMTQLLSACDVSSVPVNDGLIRSKYAAETRQIKVSMGCGESNSTSPSCGSLNCPRVEIKL